MKDYTGFYEVQDSNSITEALGITPEREKELKELFSKCITPDNKVTESMELFWKYCDHPNEFAFCIFHYGCMMTLSKVIDNELFKL